MRVKFTTSFVLVLLLIGGVIRVDQWLSRAGAQNREQHPRQTADQPQIQHRGTDQAGNRFGLSKPPPRTRGGLRVATYNTLNLFDQKDDPNLQGEYDDIKSPTDPKRCEKLAEAIRALDADIIALQEVESLEALQWFRDTFLKDAGYKFLASLDVGYYRGVECCVMSRYEIIDTKIWPHESLERIKRDGLGWSPAPAEQHFEFQRSPLMVTVRVSQNYELTVFAVHHKAGREFDYHREAEAVRITQFIDELRQADPTRNIIVMGDFNAGPFDKSYRVYLEAGMIDTLGHRLWQGDTPETALYKTHESNRVLDYILMNSAAYRETVVGSAFVYGTLTPPPSYDYRTDPQPPGYASDHYPVAVEIVPRDLR